MKEFISTIYVTLGHLQACLLKIHLSLPTLQPPHFQKVALYFMLGSMGQEQKAQQVGKLIFFPRWSFSMATFNGR
jgi:hypothetical protein